MNDVTCAVTGMEQDTATDIELIERFRGGDLGAFDELYSRYRLQLYAYLNRMMPGRSHTVDDLFQQTWIKVLDNLSGYKEQQRFMAWLFRIAHNLAIDHVRREVRHPSDELTERIAADEPVPWNELDRDVLLKALDEATGTLSPEQREVLMLRQQNVSFKEIAVIQNVSINTVLGRMHYAVGNLRKRLAEYL